MKDETEEGEHLNVQALLVAKSMVDSPRCLSRSHLVFSSVVNISLVYERRRLFL